MILQTQDSSPFTYITLPFKGQPCVVIVDAEIPPLLLCGWSLSQIGKHIYAVRPVDKNGKKTTEYLHRLVIGAEYKDGKLVDHINCNTLDNRKANLRFCTRSQNSMNRGLDKNNTSGYKGVSKAKKNKWRARIWLNDVCYLLGSGFSSPEEAASAYREAAVRLHGEFAKF